MLASSGRPPTKAAACSKVQTRSGESWLLWPGADAPYGNNLPVLSHILEPDGSFRILTHTFTIEPRSGA
jgi:hypothetical protein